MELGPHLAPTYLTSGSDSKPDFAGKGQQLSGPERGAGVRMLRNVAAGGSPQPLISTREGGKGGGVRRRAGEMSSQHCNLGGTPPQF